MSLTWTMETPKVPGWYWWKHDRTVLRAPCVVYVDELTWVQQMGDYAKHIDGQWSGPLPLPREKERGEP